MKLKPIVTALCVVGLAGTGSAFAASKDANNLQMQIDRLAAQVNALSQGGHSFVQTNSDFSKSMLNNQKDVKDVERLVKARQNGLMSKTLYVGGMIEGEAAYLRQSPQSGDSTTFTGVDLDQARLAFTPVINDWTTGFVTLDSEGNGVTVANAMLVLGNLSQMPVYGFIGKGLVNFGQFASVNTNINPLNRDVFQQRANQLGVGFDMSGFNATLTWLNGITKADTFSLNMFGPQFAISNVTQSGRIANNFAVDVNYGMTTGQVDWRLGGGYINDTEIKTSSDADTERNGAWDIYGNVAVAGFKFLGEYTQSLYGMRQGLTINFDEFGGASITIPGAIDTTSKVKSWQVAGQYSFPAMGRDTTLGVSYSRMTAGDQLKAYQVVGSLRNETFSNVWLGVSYAYNSGTVNIPGFTAGDNTTTGNTVLLDATAYF